MDCVHVLLYLFFTPHFCVFFAGGYLARTDPHSVFLCSLFFTIIDLLYIYFILPESKQLQHPHDDNANTSNMSILTIDFQYEWSPWNTLRIIAIDPFLRLVGEVAFLYYTGLWAIISTLSVYAVKRFHMGPERLGELMSALGLCTMVAEAVLVRIMVPLMGEKKAMKLGLIAFLLQCVVLGLAYEPWQLFLCAAFSLFGNLVYPSLSSLVSGSVEPEAVGEALGAVNGVKALTEGIGPLVFGSLMTLSEHSLLPGWPYLLAAVLAYLAYQRADLLPDPEDDDYIHELERKNYIHRQQNNDGSPGIMLLQHFINTTPKESKIRATSLYSRERDDEGQGLLSDIDESEDADDDGQQQQHTSSSAGNGTDDVTRLPITFASLVNIGHSNTTRGPTTPVRSPKGTPEIRSV